MTSPASAATKPAGIARVRRRDFIAADAAPTMALLWFSNKQRARLLRGWRASNGRVFAEQARCLRIAWTLEWLFGRDGFAFPTDAFLARELEMDISSVERGLQSLERGGAIIRASVFVNGRAQRRIWPSMANIPATVAGTDTRYEGPNQPATVMGQISQEGKRKTRSALSPTLLQARRASEIRERRSHERNSSTSLSHFEEDDRA